MRSAEPNSIMIERFHVLRGKKLLLYESEGDAKKGIDLIQMSQVEGFGSETKPDVGYVGITLDDDSLYFNIRVVPNAETGHSIIHMVAKSVEQKQQWKRAITKAGRRTPPDSEDSGRLVDTEQLPGFYQLRREESEADDFPITSAIVDEVDDALTAVDRELDAAADAITGRDSPDNEVQCSKC